MRPSSRAASGAPARALPTPPLFPPYSPPVAIPSSALISSLILHVTACLLLLFPALAHCSQSAWTPRAPILFGASARPFPAIFQIDYPLCRAEAWLKALANAEKRLPDAANLPQLGIRGALARQAAASLIFPIDVVTPPNADSNSIRVFLKTPDQISLDTAQLAAEPFPLLLRMCLIWETASACAKLRSIWPHSVTAARADMQQLDALAKLLENLWQAIHTPLIEPPHTPESAGILLDQAMRQPTSPASAAAAEQALRLLLQREISPQGSGNASLWNFLAAYALHLRASREERQGQPGLAEADYTAALARLKKGSFPDSLSPRALLARASLRRLRRDISGMCADFQQACSYGHCQGLANARRAGHCSEQALAEILVVLSGGRGLETFLGKDRAEVPAARPPLSLRAVDAQG